MKILQLSEGGNSNILGALEKIYPVGSIYLSVTDTCPIAELLPNSTWIKTANNLCLQGSSDSLKAGSTVSAGLPNITGDVCSETNRGGTSCLGAFYSDSSTRGAHDGQTTKPLIKFDASKSNSIYGNSNTVQPPAYIVNVWRRTL